MTARTTTIRCHRRRQAIGRCWIVAMGALTAIAGGCAPAADTAVDDVAAATADTAPAVLIPAPALAGLTLRNQRGEEVIFETLRGKPTLMTFIYTRCPMPEMCPATTLRFQEVQKALSEEDRRRVQLVSVSFDPFDTPEVLAEYGELWGVDADFWTLLTGSEESIRALASAYGAWFEKGEGNTYDHTMYSALLLADGSLHEVLAGSAWSSGDVADSLVALAADPGSAPR